MRNRQFLRTESRFFTRGIVACLDIRIASYAAKQAQDTKFYSPHSPEAHSIIHAQLTLHTYSIYPKRERGEQRQSIFDTFTVYQYMTGKTRPTIIQQ